jgi:hypothetical protein
MDQFGDHRHCGFLGFSTLNSKSALLCGLTSGKMPHNAATSLLSLINIRNLC